MKLLRAILPLSILVMGPGSFVLVAPALAAVDQSSPGRFIDTLGDTAFAALRSGDRRTARAQFRSILAQHFAVGPIGDRLIGRHRNKITPAQYSQYKAAFPGFIIATYGDRLAPYADADIKIGKVLPRGDSFAVASTVTRPNARAANAIWTVDRVGARYQVSNLTVGGINLGLTQQADFDSYIQTRGFDALVAFMKSRS